MENKAIGFQIYLTALVKRTMESLQQTTALEVPLKVETILNFHFFLRHTQLCTSSSYYESRNNYFAFHFNCFIFIFVVISFSNYYKSSKGK